MESTESIESIESIESNEKIDNIGSIGNITILQVYIVKYIYSKSKKCSLKLHKKTTFLHGYGIPPKKIYSKDLF